MDHRAFLATLPPETRRDLTARTDGRGLTRLAGHLGLIAALMLPIVLKWPLWPMALPPLGVALAFLFTLQHECTHQTPFKSRRLNEVLGHTTGLILLQPFLWFRAFHMAHHKHTNDPQNDPELSGPKPDTRAAMAWHLSTLGYWRDKALTLWHNATGSRAAPWIAERKRRAIRREARAYHLAYAAALTTLIWSPLILWLWLVPLALGFPVLRLFLLAEHGRCPQVADMFANSRTTLTTRAVHVLAWNMPYHAEHHAWPLVPFHALPALHDLAQPHLKTVAPGYTDFTRDTLKNPRT